MLKPSGFEFDGEQIRKINTFYKLLSEGKEFYYTPFPDALYADLNYTLANKHLAMAMLRHLDEEIAEKTEEIMKDKDRSKLSKVTSVARLVKGKNLVELYEASLAAVKEVDVPEYARDEIRRLDKTSLRIWTDTPRQTAEIFIRQKIDPIYNSSGDVKVIMLYATELQHDNGILNGVASFIPDEFFRHNIQHLDYLSFLNKNIQRIA